MKTPTLSKETIALRRILAESTTFDEMARKSEILLNVSVKSAIEAERNRTNDILQILKGVTRYVEYPIEQYEYDQLAGKVVVGSNENPIEMLSKRDVEVFNATSKMIWGKVEKNIEALAEKEL